MLRWGLEGAQDRRQMFRLPGEENSQEDMYRAEIHSPVWSADNLAATTPNLLRAFERVHRAFVKNKHSGKPHPAPSVQWFWGKLLLSVRQYRRVTSLVAGVPNGVARLEPIQLLFSRFASFNLLISTSTSFSSEFFAFIK